MSIQEFSARCFAEYKEKNEKRDTIITYVFAAICFVVSFIVNIFFPIPFFENEFFNFMLSLLVYGFAGVMLFSPILDIFDIITKQYPRSVIENAARSGSYLNYPNDYPEFILYPGEQYLVISEEEEDEEEEEEDTEQDYEEDDLPLNQKAESVIITCSKCGQQISIPPIKGTVQFTCPKCGEKSIVSEE